MKGFDGSGVSEWGLWCGEGCQRPIQLQGSNPGVWAHIEEGHEGGSNGTEIPFWGRQTPDQTPVLMWHNT